MHEGLQLISEDMSLPDLFVLSWCDFVLSQLLILFDYKTHEAG